jgi:predicted enzyme related to lactoylglutathione lyase
MSHLNINSQITWVYTENLELTSSFYEKDLGFDLVRNEGSARIFRVCDTASIGVCMSFEDRIVEPRGGMITFVTDDVDKWYSRLSQQNIKVRGTPHRLEEFGIYTFFVEDPNGYVLEFQQFLD